MEDLIKNPVFAVRALLLVLFVLLAPAVSAHHGRDKLDEDPLVIEGEILQFTAANPHSELVVLVGDQVWFIELGPPWRNQQAGLTPDKLAVGVQVRVLGHSASDREQWLKAVRVSLDGRNYDLYPGRIR